jgi:hypothetical protein
LWIAIAEPVVAQTDATPIPTQSDAGRVAIKPPVRTDDDLGFTAPLVAVDRFSDAAGTLFRRSKDQTLPAPNAPFSLDDKRFVVPVTGADGEAGRCYNLDVRPARPHRYYVFYDTIGNYRLGQYPVIDTIPGDPGYSDIWDIWKIVTPNSFRETNWVRDADTVEKLLADPAAGYEAHSTGIFLNAPVVPEGTTASMKGEGREGAALMLYAWYKGKRAPFLYLEGRFRLTEQGTVPTGKLVAPGPTATWPPEAPLTGAIWPRRPAYAPLVAVETADKRPLFPGFLNCPIVGAVAP